MNLTQQKGKTTELKCQLFFIENGYNVFIPLSEDSRCDMIVNINSILYRIQIKSSHLNEKETGIEFNPYSMRMNHTEGNIRVQYSEEDVDFFMTEYENQCYLIPLNVCGKGAKTLSFKQNGNATLLVDYEASKILKQLENDVEQIEGTIQKRGVYKKDKNTGEILATYNSFAEAAADLGDSKKISHISQAARNQRKTAYGFVWEIF